MTTRREFMQTATFSVLGAAGITLEQIPAAQYPDPWEATGLPALRPEEKADRITALLGQCDPDGWRLTGPEVAPDSHTEYRWFLVSRQGRYTRGVSYMFDLSVQLDESHLALVLPVALNAASGFDLLTLDDDLDHFPLESGGGLLLITAPKGRYEKFELDENLGIFRTDAKADRDWWSCSYFPSELRGEDC